MTDDIDIVEYLRLWASPDPDNQQVRDLHRAADEIERLREELKDADDDFHALKAMFDKMRAEVRGE